jgi:Ribonucleotide reductase, beta subunit
MSDLKKKPLFNPGGDTDVRLRRMIGGNTTNLNDFNNLRYTWVNNWYRQAMNNFWIPEEINLSQDIKDYPNLTDDERTAYNKILKLSCIPGFHPDCKPPVHRRIHYRKRDQSLPLDPGISGMCAQPELQLYAGLHLQSGRTKRHSLPVEE